MATVFTQSFTRFQAADGTYGYDNDGVPYYCPTDSTADLSTGRGGNPNPGGFFTTPAPSVAVNRNRWRARFNAGLN